MRRQIYLVFAIILFLAFDGQAEPLTESKRHPWNRVRLHEISLGILAHDVDDLWSGTRKEGGFDINAEMVFKQPLKDLFHGRIRPNLGVSINSQNDTSKIYGGILWELASRSLFFNVGIGLAIHDGELKANKDNKKGLGARILFRIPIEAGLTIHGRHRFSIIFEHISNGYIAHPNEGLDSLGLKYGFLFN
ncbi:MAG: acyloxyacyl hydrolase [Desulfobacterales bacterium]|nr:MAG: acyloxyacyl hydrolase [Desulfobacterales bacterium]